jgi:hypothetical protein
MGRTWAAPVLDCWLAESVGFRRATVVLYLGSAKSTAQPRPLPVGPTFPFLSRLCMAVELPPFRPGPRVGGTMIEMRLLWGAI